ncbi:glycosyltransferase family 4 protein [Parasphingorhabdus cellanae]|uniref:Glycosyltransferase family 1 protein n=1 Tax=Parasphingorhabdus cellanae TaxID=2806553 RepID=A0ABX7T5B2_9SPHN|nr:glycosyltransferase family 1 protein [Parasphingorhabdus cellanae]QTD56779.1 glycosyltransferase family 1 protein [Parasphingorhabdus cellanae]
MKIALVTDAWHPQVNGVVRTLDTVIGILRYWGHEVLVISPDQYRSVAAPSYPEIRLAVTRARSVGQRIAEFDADAIHLATEGPLCLSARRWCRRNHRPFTTAYHTQFPEYLAKRTYFSPRIFWLYIRWFHRPSQAIMVSTNSVRQQLIDEHLPQVHHWSRGVDLDNFSPDAPTPDLFKQLPRPIQLYVGRVAVEKNIETFLKTDQPGSKVVVGDGPALKTLRKDYPEAYFLGRKSGRELAGCYAGADVFVFPSKTDTFGLVLIEALACGTPVAAFPVTGPIDILTGNSGVMDDDLNRAIAAAQCLHQNDCLERAAKFSWGASASQFLDGLVPIEPDRTVHLSRRFIAKAIFARA